MRRVHVCLLPTEILLVVFTIIREEPGTRDSLKRDTNSIAALARTCRTFKEPALDVLWENISGIKPLISFLPEGVISRTAERKLSLRRPLSTVEWKIFAQNARRIHSLVINNCNLDEISEQVVEALVSTPSFALLPNLRKLQWLDDRECFFPLLRTLLVPTITSIKLGTDSSMQLWLSSFPKSALLASLGARCPSIRELDCVYGHYSDICAGPISEAVCCCCELVRLKTGVLNAQALDHLASLLSLKSLHFQLSYGDDDTPPTDSIRMFTSKLDELSITATSHTSLTQCFRNVHFLSCRSVVLSIDSDCMDPDEPYDPLDIPGLIVAFSECFSPVLEQLHVKFEFNYDNESILNDHRFAFGFDVIAPFLQFSHLTMLDLDWLCTSDVDDEAFKNMVQSWPLLEEFHFGSGDRWLVPPSLTFTGLVHLIHHCRHLRRIDIHFTACSIDANSEPFSITLPNEMITWIFVGFSPIVDPKTVACQLHALLPNLKDVVCHGWGGDDDHEEPFDGQWNRVNEYLQVLTEGAVLREKIGGLWEES
ncbi:hypothetical protein K503DRAFT_870402 [Rhizopogon vinicolor AM-OR11-026]|uniref:F-box domain-containing protein n=1 Tax=Rhizopogon vinicolor AM-OR11-026 TaxID=1314800 RepID=A0A1B7MH88_9AGAM|nr:hypothetical protein K503DRAFT_870402 [Rhizopogon vinicolor AM-OR11-026]